ncbi:MAG: hypothetical protein RL045_1541 [Bacteroidota bacterium]|jgi:hypothetical protein
MKRNSFNWEIQGAKVGIISLKSTINTLRNKCFRIIFSGNWTSVRLDFC